MKSIILLIIFISIIYLIIQYNNNNNDKPPIIKNNNIENYINNDLMVNNDNYLNNVCNNPYKYEKQIDYLKPIDMTDNHFNVTDLNNEFTDVNKIFETEINKLVVSPTYKIIEDTKRIDFSKNNKINNIVDENFYNENNIYNTYDDRIIDTI